MTWDECQKEVKGFKNAIFKSFMSRNEAEKFLTGENLDTKSSCETVAYVDGSYDNITKRYSSGIFMLVDGKEITEKKVYKDDYSVFRNVAGEVCAAITALNIAKKYNKKSIVIYHDYEGIRSWALGFWKRNNELTKKYKQIYDDMKNEMDITFIKVKAHSNNANNDKADLLAKDALNKKNHDKHDFL